MTGTDTARYADLVDALGAKLRAQALAVIADERTKRLHPSYITKREGIETLNRMRGGWDMYRAVIGEIPTDLYRLLNDAVSASNEWI